MCEKAPLYIFFVISIPLFFNVLCFQRISWQIECTVLSSEIAIIYSGSHLMSYRFRISRLL